MPKKNSFKKKLVIANPFDLKVTRLRHEVLGNKLKGTKGTPSFSHTKRSLKQKELWKKNKIQANKSNRFIDKRLNIGLSSEEKATYRLIQEKKRKFKTNIYELNDAEELTHEGQPLSHIKEFTCNFSDEEDILDDKFVQDNHFGGFTTDGEPYKSRKEIIGQLILDSKYKKDEQKKEKEKYSELTEKLDKEWKEIHSLMTNIKINHNDIEEKKDPFDIAIQELKFESRSKPPSIIKSAEEIAKENQNILKKLEDERLIRMKDAFNNVYIELSADSIYDGIDIDPNFADNIKSTSLDYEDEADADQTTNFNENKTIQTNFDQDIDEELNKKISRIDIPLKINDLNKLVEENSFIRAANILEEKLNTLEYKSQNMYKLEILFSLLLEFICKSCKIENHLQQIHVFFPHLYSLAKLSNLKMAHKFLEFLNNEIKIFQNSKAKNMKSNFPRIETLVILKLCGILYCTSDFRHPVVTPAIIFMCDILSSKFRITFHNIICRLFISARLLEYVSFSKRLIPEVLHFLNKVLKLAINQESNLKNYYNFLLVESVVKIKEIPKLDLFLIFSDKVSHKLSIIQEIIRQFHHFSSLYIHLDTFSELFSETLDLCSKLPIQNYPISLKNEISLLINNISKHPRSKSHLTFPYKKPKPLKLYEPSYESKFLKNNNCEISKKLKQAKSLSKKVRKEELTLLREIRKDCQMMAIEKLNTKIEADQERKRKVKQIYHDLASQEGEYKKFLKANK